MHKGQRLKIPIVEKSNHEWHKFTTYNALELEGRPTKVLKKLVDTGLQEKWWTTKSLRNSEAFKKLVIICWGEAFWKHLEEMEKEGMKWHEASPPKPKE